MKLKRKHLYFGIGLLIMLCVSAGVYGWKRQPTVLHIGVYAGSSWDVPTSQRSHALDRAIEKFEKSHPNVRVEYENGIPQSEYSNWLSEKIVSGKTPDVFMVSEQDISLLAARGVLENLNGYMSQKDQATFYTAAFESCVYQGQPYALPYESNPILMCVNKDLLDKEGIEVPKEGWSLEEFYEICKELTKDTNGDGQLDQFGSTEYTWKEALAANGGSLFQGGMLKLTAPEVKESLTFLQKLEELNKNYKVSSKDFDQGKVAFYPMTLAQYRTYKPYPYHVSKYSNFTWTCIPMPAKSKTTKATLVTTTSFAMSARTPHSKLAWELMQVLTEDPEIQQTLFAESQGISVMPDVVKSRSSKDLLQVDDFGADSLTNQTLNRIMEQAVESSPKNVSKEVLEKLDYLIGNALRNQDVENRLPQIQREIESSLQVGF